MAYLTPSADTGVVYRTLAIPTPFLSQVSGALIELEKAWNWEEYGDMSVDECTDAMTAMIDRYYQGNVMVGMVVPYAGALSEIPDNCLLCDGSVHDRVDYPDLYAILPAAYIDDADTFHTPDLVSRFVMGTDENEGETGGEATHTLTTDEMPPHAHADAGHTHAEGIAAPSLTTVGLELPEPTAIPAASVTGIGYANIQSAGGGDPHNNLPPLHALTYIIVAR